jgi:hypothetical protein
MGQRRSEQFSKISKHSNANIDQPFIIKFFFWLAVVYVGVE